MGYQQDLSRRLGDFVTVSLPPLTRDVSAAFATHALRGDDVRNVHLRIARHAVWSRDLAYASLCKRSPF
jgi:hypothetical protein